MGAIVRLFGYYVYIQNIYGFDLTPLDPFRQVESWIFMHGYMPGFIRLLVIDMIVLYAVCELWERFEVLWSIAKQIYEYIFPRDGFVYDSLGFMGCEPPTDSLGDVIQGVTVGLWSSYFMWISGLPSGYLWCRRTWSQLAWRIFIVVIQACSHLIATVMFVERPSDPIYYWSISEWWTSKPNLFVIGWWIWFLIVQPLIIWWSWYEDVQFAREDALSYGRSMEEPVKQWYNFMIAFYLFEGFLCSSFVMPTYYAYWTGQLALLFIFSIIHRQYYQHLEWRTFLPYLFASQYFQDKKNSAIGLIKKTNRQQRFGTKIR